MSSQAFPFRSLIPSAAILFTLLMGLDYVKAEPIERVPDALDGVGVDENVGAVIPLELKFLNSDAKHVSLKSVFDDGLPVLITMNYSTCPLLCDQQLNGLVDALRDMEATAGEDYKLITISYDPRETPGQAQQMQTKYLQEYERAGSRGAWSFLVGNAKNIVVTADALGIRYKYLKMKRQYSHPAVAVLCTPQGQVARYIYGVSFSPEELDQWVIEAAEGKLQSPSEGEANKWLATAFRCFFYDNSEGVYTSEAMIVMRIGGVLGICSILGLFYACHRMVKQAKKNHAESVAQSPGSASTNVGMVN